MNIRTWIDTSTKTLADAGIQTAKLDAELILCHTIRQPRTYLHAHDDEQIPSRQQEIADSRLTLRIDRVPLAYIIGHKEFYGRSFCVTPSVLIPRPESESIIEILKHILPDTQALPGHTMRLIDIGTGSGCLGITAKLEFPELDVTLADISRHALTVAEKNAITLKAKVSVLKSDLLQQYVFSPDIIIANLPYVAESWERSPETNHEPTLALFARGKGLQLIKKLIPQASDSLPNQGILLLEADPEQHDAITSYCKAYNLKSVSKNGYCLAFIKD
jgi:release factor glutamine methyltransferase